MKKLLLLAVATIGFFFLSSGPIIADDDPVRLAQTTGLKVLTANITGADLIKKIREEGNYEVSELRLYFRDGKLLAVEPINRKKADNIKLLKDLRGERIRNVMGVAINQESPVCTYWYSLWGWEKLCN